MCAAVGTGYAHHRPANIGKASTCHTIERQREKVRIYRSYYDTLQRQNAENLKQIFPEKEYRGLSLNLHIHVSVSELYIPSMGLPALLEEICRLILGIYKSLKDT
jgi:hypothetical protein